jgi:hypothetical protein
VQIQHIIICVHVYKNVFMAMFFIFPILSVVFFCTIIFSTLRVFIFIIFHKLKTVLRPNTKRDRITDKYRMFLKEWCGFRYV